MLKTITAILLTILCWGTYGPLLHHGQVDMGGSRLRPFICVGLAYFLIAVLVPGIFLYLKGEKGNWTMTGAVWSLAAGALGALGSLGIIMAFAFGGAPVFVMPLVFGGAPVVNSFLTIFMTKSLRQVGPIFLAGLILVVTGAVTVLIFKPGTGAAGGGALSFERITFVIAWVAITALSWGSYGPILHKGQMKMAGSRLRPLMCVGLSYFAVAVLVPLLILGAVGEQGHWSATGTFWSLIAGTITTLGALGIIMAFAFGGKPVYVMPLVFGGAPVINTFFSMATGVTTTPGPLFYAGLIIVAVGAVIVLVFAPKGAPHGAK